MIAGDAETRALYVLADRQGWTIGQVLDLPVEELRGWMAFLEWVSDQQKRKG